MAAAKRKRRPGGGRKALGPISGKSSNFSTRITSKTRADIEAEAQAAGLSISQAAERILQTGIEAIRERQTVGATKALRFLVGQLADDCSVKPGSKRLEWNEDAFIFEAFKQSLIMLLDEIRPRGSDVERLLSSENDIPFTEAWRAVLSSPEQLAKHAFLGLWQDLHRIDRTDVERSESELGMDPRTAGIWVRYANTLADVRRDLGIGEKKS